MRQTTLCFLIREGEILLAMKKRGFGKGKWNGYGGKQETDESIENAAIREMREEIGVMASIENLEKVAAFCFYFKTAPEWNQQVNVFLVRSWHGESIETEEMKPEWFTWDNIPYQDMWSDDKLWLPHILDGKKLVGEFYFNSEATGFDKYNLREIDSF